MKCRVELKGCALFRFPLCLSVTPCLAAACHAALAVVQNPSPDLLCAVCCVLRHVVTAGKLWGYENYGVEPDLMSLAKPLAGGLPIGAVLLKQKVADVMKPGEGTGGWNMMSIYITYVYIYII